MEIKDYEDEESLDPSEFDKFSGAIIVIGMIVLCGILIAISKLGII